MTLDAGTRPLTALHVIETLEPVGGTPRKLLALVHATTSLGLPLRHELLTFRAGGLEPELRAAGAGVSVAGTTDPIHLAFQLRRALQRGVGSPSVVVSHFVRALLVARVGAGRVAAHIHMVHGASEIGRIRSRWISRACLPGVDLVVANSRFTLDQLQGALGTDDLPATVIHNPVRRREPTGTVEWPTRVGDGPVVLAVGGFIPLRRHDLLLRAFQMVHSQNPTTRLVLVGDGPLRGEMEQLARDLDIYHSTWFAGYQRHVGDFLARAAVFVSAADAEGFGVAVGEALLSATPLVLPANAVYRELYASSGFGHFFTPGDATQLAERTIAALRSSADPDGDPDVSALEDRYSADRYASRFFDLARRLVRSRLVGGAGS